MHASSLFKRFPVLIVLGIVGLFGTAAQFSGCSSTQVDPNDPASLMKDAEEDIQRDHYQIALDKLRTVKNKFPYSKYSLEAQIRMADVYFLQESFPEAAAAYETFIDLHPKHEKVPYALFRVAKSYLSDIPDPISRDMTPGQKALEAYNDFLRRFPSAPQAEEARKDLNSVRTQLADKELYVGDFYYKREGARAAKTRYIKLVQLYPETEAAKKAQKKLEGIEDRIRKEDEAEKNANPPESAKRK